MIGAAVRWLLWGGTIRKIGTIGATTYLANKATGGLVGEKFGDAASAAKDKASEMASEAAEGAIDRKLQEYGVDPQTAKGAMGKIGEFLDKFNLGGGTIFGLIAGYVAGIPLPGNSWFWAVVGAVAATFLTSETFKNTFNVNARGTEPALNREAAPESTREQGVTGPVLPLNESLAEGPA